MEATTRRSPSTRSTGRPALGDPSTESWKNSFLTGLAERMPLLEQTHPLASEIALLAFDEVNWVELSEALIEVIEHEPSGRARKSRRPGKAGLKE